MGSHGAGSRTHVEDLLSTGSTELGSGNWAAASEAYRAALDETESAGAHEGLGAASWWLRDDVTTAASRRKAFRLYLDDRDGASAARVAVSLAWDHIFRGERSVAGGWIQRAQSLLEDVGPVAESGWLLIVKAHMALLADRDPQEAGRLALEAIAVGKAIGNRDVEMLALAYEGFALVSAGRVADGMRKLDESSTAAMSGELESVNATATVTCCLIFACERVRDFGRAAEWCARLKEFCELWSFELMIAICRTHYASTLVSQGLWQEAEIELMEAKAGFGKTHPGQAAEALVRLADLRVRQGRLDEATELLDEVESGPARMMGHKIALAVRAALLLARGDAQAAVNNAQRFLRSIPDEESLELVSALEVLVQANIMLGDEQAARAALAKLRSLADSVNTDPMRAAALVAQGAVAYAFGDLASSRVALEDAANLFGSVGALYEMARAHLLLANCLHADGGDQAAAGHAGDALQVAQALGAELLIGAARDLLADLGVISGQESFRFPGLTERESEILRLVARGLENKEIATRLVLSIRTVERHISNIYLKLGLEGPAARASATATALQHGLV